MPHEAVTGRRAMDFDHRMAVGMKPLDQDEIDRGHPPDQILEWRFLLVDLVEESPAVARDDHDVRGTRFAMPMRVLAGAVDVEAVMGVFDRRDGQAAGAQFGEQAHQERRLPRTAPPGQSEDLHHNTPQEHLVIGDSPLRSKGSALPASAPLGSGGRRQRRPDHMEEGDGVTAVPPGAPDVRASRPWRPSSGSRSRVSVHRRRGRRAGTCSR